MAQGSFRLSLEPARMVFFSRNASKKKKSEIPLHWLCFSFGTWGECCVVFCFRRVLSVRCTFFSERALWPNDRPTDRRTDGPSDHPSIQRSTERHRTDHCVNRHHRATRSAVSLLYPSSKQKSTDRDSTGFSDGRSADGPPPAWGRPQEATEARGYTSYRERVPRAQQGKKISTRGANATRIRGGGGRAVAVTWSKPEGIKPKATNFSASGLSSSIIANSSSSSSSSASPLVQRPERNGTEKTRALHPPTTPRASADGCKHQVRQSTTRYNELKQSPTKSPTKSPSKHTKVQQKSTTLQQSTPKYTKSV